MVKCRSKVRKVLTIGLDSQIFFLFFFEKEECTYICPSVNVTINIKNRQNIEIQVVEKSCHDVIFSIGLNSLVGES